MSEYRPNPLNPLLGKIERYEESSKSIRQFESSRVEWTLRSLGLEAQRREILQGIESLGGYFTFSEFNRVVSFPINLISESLHGEMPIHRDQKSTHPMWFKGFRSLPVIQKYEDYLNDYLQDGTPKKPLGMVFPRKGFSQGLIVHNGDFDLYVPPKSSCHVYKGGTTHSMNLIVQPYMGLINHLKETLK